MSTIVRNSFLAVLIATCAIVAAPSTARAQAKAKPACGLKAFPFVPGTQWVYTAVAPPEESRATALKIAASKAKQPDKFTIKVVSVVPSGQNAEITLEETTRGVTKTTKLTCTKDALDVPPESFLFSGEPGGGLAIELAPVTRPAGEHSYVLQLGQLRVPEWIENLTTTFTRKPSEGVDVKLDSGTINMQRIVKRGGPESITTALGTFTAIPVQVELVGTITLDTPNKEVYNIPANILSKVWVADNIGVVQAFNSNGHMYQLTEATIGGQPAPAGKPAPAAPGQPKPAPAAKPAQAAPSQPAAPAAAPSQPTPAP